MPLVINIAGLALVGLLVFGYYTTWHLAERNGTVGFLDASVASGRLPGTKEPLKASYTGFAPLDQFLNTLVVFFWPSLDGSNPASSLLCYHFAGQAFTACGLLIMESLRAGNRWRTISFVTIWGLLIQSLSFAVIGPIYIFAYLFMSPTVTMPKRQDLEVKTADMLAILPALTIGLICPTILMNLPAPSVISFDHKQTFIAAWQVFPLWVCIAGVAFSFAIGHVIGPEGNKASPRIYMRVVYTILAAAATLNHFSVSQFTATSMLFPSLYSDKYRDVLTVANVFKPAAITPSAKMESLSQGAHLFLQYDEMTMVETLRVFAVTLLICGIKQQQIKVWEHKLALSALVLLSVQLPISAAVIMVWLRDEIVLSGKLEQKKNA